MHTSRVNPEICFRLDSTKVLISYGDIFECEAHKVIGVNDFFDTDIGQTVSRGSLHGQFLDRHFKGREDLIEPQIQSSLMGIEKKYDPTKHGKKDRYAIGTTAKVVVPHHGVFVLLALTKTDPRTLKVSTDLVDYMFALKCLWGYARVSCGGETLNVPLLGNGLARMGLPETILLRLMLASLLYETKRDPLGCQVQLILSPDLRSHLDITALVAEWK